MPSEKNKRQLKGFSLSVLGFGISAQWENVPSERRALQSLVNFLGDRRVLFDPVHREIANAAVASVLEIRGQLGKTLDELDPDGEAFPHVELMQAACRKFLTDCKVEPYAVGQTSVPAFFVALGELRAMIGLQISGLAASHKLRVPAALKSSFPVEIVQS